MKNIVIVLLILAVGALVKFNAYAIAEYLPEHLNAIKFFAVFIYFFYIVIKYIVKKKNESDQCKSLNENSGVKTWSILMQISL